MKEYKDIPVRAAVEIAEQFDKDIVVILAWNHEHHKFHTVTYGVAPKDKTPAANLGEIVTKAAGGDVSQKAFVEDFRKNYSAAKQAAMKRALERIRDYPVHSEPVGGAMAMQDIADEALKQTQSS